MTRSQAAIIGVLFGLVLLIFMGIVVFLFFMPFEEIFAPEPTPTATSLPPSPTPTFPNFLPTANLQTPAPTEPTATNTRLPTATPRPPRTATPTIVFILTLPPRNTATSTPTILIPPTLTGAPDAEPTPTIQLQYSISFEAKDARIDKGDCTSLEWRVLGATAAWLEGKRVSLSGREEVCPRKQTTYRLTAQLPDGVQVDRSVTVDVRDVDNANDNNN